ncbi:STAS/SEC14 domain-containing protein [uncultured Flavobacterium sp.]|uniref:STAS/SEC14 domain-containing protein n=1 Tax=uncultured Flavobacterium sp. TaxID=165435 RepID=UPI0030EE142F
MFKLEKIPNKNIYKFTIDEVINEENIHEFLKILEEETKEHQKIRVLGIIKKIPSLENFATLKATLKMKVEALKNIGKYALLTDKDWIRNMIPVADYVTPKIEIKAFELEDEDDAISWLEADFTKTVEADDYLTKMDVQHIPDTNIYTFTFDNDIDEAGMLALKEIFDHKSKDQKIRLLVTLNKFPDFESFKSFYEALKVDFRSLGNVGKYAIVSNKSWLHNWVKFADFIVPGMKMSHFSNEEKNQAIEWLKE